MILASTRVIRLLCLSLLAAGTAGCAGSDGMKRTPSGLQVLVLSSGTGPRAEAGQAVWIVETTSKTDGTVVYSNMGQAPVRFRLGARQATDGMDEGVRGMRVGERRLLILPPELAKRSEYPDNISPSDTLIIEVELTRIGD